MVMSMMFMNMAATKTTLTLILGLMRIRGMALAGDEAEPDLTTGVVAVGVDQDDALPGAQQQSSAQDGNGERGADQGGEHVIGAVALGAVPVPVPVIPWQ